MEDRKNGVYAKKSGRESSKKWRLGVAEISILVRGQNIKNSFSKSFFYEDLYHNGR